MTGISDEAERARESHRTPGGQFGVQPLDHSKIPVPGTPPSRPALPRDPEAMAVDIFRCNDHPFVMDADGSVRKVEDEHAGPDVHQSQWLEIKAPPEWEVMEEFLPSDKLDGKCATWMWNSTRPDDVLAVAELTEEDGSFPEDPILEGWVVVRRRPIDKEEDR